MTKTHDDGGPAFPVDDQYLSGMTLRDWFAGQALNALMSSSRAHEFSIRDAAYNSYDYAAAMLAARDEGGDQ